MSDDSGVYMLAESEILRMVPYQSKAELKMSLGRLRTFKRSLIEEQRDLDRDLEKRYEELTPGREAKYPERFARKWSEFIGVETQYRKVSDILAEIELRQAEGKVKLGEKEEGPGSREGNPQDVAEQRQLFAVLGG